MARAKGKSKGALLPFPNQHGGYRKGAGRKPKNGHTAGVGHDTRDALASRFPVLVTVKLREHLPALRDRETAELLRSCFVDRGNKPGFRLCQYAILNDHLHFVCEAKDRDTLSRGLQGLLVSIARRLNKHWKRKGSVFADRYHDRILRSPREVRNAIRYVLTNGKKHESEGRQIRVRQAIDCYTSAPWFDGFREHLTIRGIEAIITPIAHPHTWLLRKGWRRHGLLSVHEKAAG